MRDKRRHQRPKSPHRINVLSATDDRILGRLVDVTAGGLMFLTDREYEEGMVLQLRLPLPRMANGKTAIEVEGPVIWTREDQNPRFQRVGLRFDHLGAEEAYIIETVLQRLHLVG